MRRVEVDLVELGSASRSMPHAAMNRSARSISAGERVVATAFRAGVATYSRFHACTLRQVGEAALGERAQQVQRGRRLVVRAHEPLRVGRARAAASNAKSFTMSPRNDGSSMPSRVSVGDERGLANWPAMRPIFTVGTPLP